MSTYYLSRGDDRFIFHPDHVADPERFQAVVVIDPEDREQVERLAALLWPYYSEKKHAHLHKAEITADALREFAKPQRQVFEHYPATETSKGATLALCGKVWEPDPDVQNMGRCSACEEIVEAGWTV